jgi:hypothetical protein
MCDQGTESMDHILLGYCFSREVWHFWIRKLHLQDAVSIAEEPALQWWLRDRKRVPKPVRRGFDSLFFLIGWTLWKERNARTFNRTATSATQLAMAIQDDIETWCQAGFKHLRSLMALM